LVLCPFPKSSWLLLLPMLLPLPPAALLLLLLLMMMMRHAVFAAGVVAWVLLPSLFLSCVSVTWCLS
jgi:hypothetical protein